MADFFGSLDFIGAVEEKTTDKQEIINSEITEPDGIIKINTSDLICEPFSITTFATEIEEMSAEKNELRSKRSGNITGYDIAHNCIRQVIYRLRNTPVPNWADSWLPIHFRSTIGSAIHEFIQNNTKQLTEIEANLKVPSIGFYGKIDGLIGSNVLVEIKSCPYSDYATILRQQKPRKKDYLQAMCYRYILENYAIEAKDPKIELKHGGDKPKLDQYNIDKLQFIYVAHDIIASDLEDYGEMLQNIKHTKKALNSKKNQFYFLTSLVVDVNDEIKKDCDTWVKGKIDAIHSYLKSNTLPAEDDDYIKRDGCYFCQYSQICDIKKSGK